jgi:hypothetical protein
MKQFAFLLVLVLAAATAVQGFMPVQPKSMTRATFSPLGAEAIGDDGAVDPNEIVARRIIVKGDVQGGYYRSCVVNEVRTV